MVSRAPWASRACPGLRDNMASPGLPAERGPWGCLESQVWQGCLVTEESQVMLVPPAPWA